MAVICPRGFDSLPSEYKEVAIKKLEHIVRCEAGHDCVKFECKWNHPACIPGTGGTHGVRGLILRFVVKGDKGAVQFVLLTDWVPQYATRSSLPLYVKEWKYKSSFDCYPIPIDLGYHSKVPMHDGQEPISKSCEFTSGACYYDGSSLNAAEAIGERRRQSTMGILGGLLRTRLLWRGVSRS